MRPKHIFRFETKTELKQIEKFRMIDRETISYDKLLCKNKLLFPLLLFMRDF